MVVTSRMLAAHTSGYPVDVRARFWSTYYRSLKDITNEESRPRASESYQPRGGTTFQPSGPMTLHKSTFPLVLNTISPSVRPSCHLWSGSMSGLHIHSDRPILWRNRCPRQLWMLPVIFKQHINIYIFLILKYILISITPFHYIWFGVFLDTYFQKLLVFNVFLATLYDIIPLYHPSFLE